jgi:hypothetical protein
MQISSLLKQTVYVIFCLRVKEICKCDTRYNALYPVNTVVAHSRVTVAHSRVTNVCTCLVVYAVLTCDTIHFPVVLSAILVVLLHL